MSEKGMPQWALKEVEEELKRLKDSRDKAKKDLESLEDMIAKEELASKCDHPKEELTHVFYDYEIVTCQKCGHQWLV